MTERARRAGGMRGASTARATRRLSCPEGTGARERIPKAEHSRRTRELIVETGLKCLAKHGYGQTTMLLISQQAGLSRGPMAYHFSDRYELMGAIAELLPSRVDPSDRERLSTTTTLSDRLTTMIDVALEGRVGDHHFVAAELLIAARKDARLAAAIRPHFLRGETSMDDWWLDYFRLLRRPRRELLALRKVVVACLRGLALDHVLQKDEAAHTDALRVFRLMFLNFTTRRPKGPWLR